MPLFFYAYNRNPYLCTGYEEGMVEGKMTAGEAAVALGVSVDTVRRWDKLGLLHCTRDTRGRRLFDVDEVERIKRQHEHGGDRGVPRFHVLESEPTEHASLELFAGAGGTALGMSNAGFRHIMLNEWDHDACETLRANRPEWNVVEGDVHDIDFTPYAGTVDLLQGGVPCQAFSYAGKSMGFGDTRGTLFFEFARAIDEVRPKVIMMENVRGLLTHDHGRTIQTMCNRLLDLGYRFAVKVLRAQFLDVAQKRERLVLLGVRDDVDAPILYPRQCGELLTLWDAIGDVPAGEGSQYPTRKREIMELVPAGGYWRDLPDDLQREYLAGSYHLSGGKTGMARRLSWDEPSLTLTCAPAQKQTERCHPVETRPLNVREYARIQSFPDTWEFTGSTASKYKQIGNAVPVNMAYHVGRAIIAMLEGAQVDDFAEVAPLTREQVGDVDYLKRVALEYT